MDTTKHSGEHVLVVDDEPAVRRTLMRFVVHLGHEAQVAGTAAEALEAIRTNRPTVVLLDVGLPDRRGIDVISEALALDPNVAILMLSGAADLELANAATSRGALAYLTKPIDLTDLAVAVDAALESRERRCHTHGGCATSGTQRVGSRPTRCNSGSYTSSAVTPIRQMTGPR